MIEDAELTWADGVPIMGRAKAKNARWLLAWEKRAAMKVKRSFGIWSRGWRGIVARRGSPS
jgi:hypothetical protein